MAQVPDQAPPRSYSQAQAQSNADFGPKSSQDDRDAARLEQEKIENANNDFIRSKTKEIELSSALPTYKEVDDLFKQFQPTNSHWQSTFTSDHKNMASAYYELANTIIEKWKAKESMSDEEALWITRHLNLILLDKRSIKGHKLFEDAKFREKIIHTIVDRQQNDKDAFIDLLRNIKMLAPAAAPAAAAAAAAPAPALESKKEAADLLIKLIETQTQMDAAVRQQAMRCIAILRGTEGGYRRRTKHSKKHSNKSRKCRKSRRH